MKVSSVVIPAVLLFCSCHQDQKKMTSDMIHFPRSASGDVSDQIPAMAFDSTVIHFPTMAEGEKQKFSYRFSNSGNVPLVIAQVTSECGCTVIEDWPKSPVAPGATGTIDIEFNSTARAGDVNKAIHIQANTVPATTTLHLSGVVKGIQKEKPIQNPVFAPVN